MVFQAEKLGVRQTHWLVDKEMGYDWVIKVANLQDDWHFSCCGDWIRMTPIGSSIWVLIPWEMVFYSAQDSSPCVGTMAHKHETSHHSEAKSKTSPWWVQIRKADTIEVLISDFFLFCDVETTSSRAMLKFTETSSYHQDSPCLVFWLETSSFWSSNVHTVYVSRLRESPVCNECHLCFSYKIKDPGMCHGPANHITQVLLIKKKIQTRAT